MISFNVGNNCSYMSTVPLFQSPIMGKMGLQISARMENVKQIEVCGPDFRWFIKTRCTNCGELSDKWQYVTVSETYEGRTGRSDCHMKAKCKGCSREVSLVILEDTIKPYMHNEDKEEDFQTIVVFEGRGIEIDDFEFRVSLNNSINTIVRCKFLIFLCHCSC